MSRLVEARPKTPPPVPPVPGAADLTSGGGDQDPLQKLREYGERVAKYIPAEVLAFYTAVVQLGLTKGGDEHRGLRLWLFAVVGIISWLGTPILLGLYSNDPKTKYPNQIIGFFAFGVWAYAYPAGWFAEMKWYDPFWGALLLLAFTFGVAFYVPKKS